MADACDLCDHKNVTEVMRQHFLGNKQASKQFLYCITDIRRNNTR